MSVFAPDQQPIVAQEPATLAAAVVVEQAFVDAIAKAEKSVVAIARVRKQPAQPDLTPDDDLRLFFPARPNRRLDPDSPEFVPNDYGSGIVIDRAGFIVTNYHVLGEIENSIYWVWSNRKSYVAEVKAADPWLDLAVLKIAAENLEPVTFGDAKHLKKGQLVVTLGNPHAIARDGQPSASWGIISNLLRKAPGTSSPARGNTGRDTLHHFGTLIQTDAKLNLGTSGGALLNLKGELIGLTTSLAALDGNDTAAGFAIPVDETFRRAVETMKAGRKPEYGFLGVAPEPLVRNGRSPQQHGVRVNQVVRSTPAERAGVQIGDVITHVGEVEIHDDVDLIRELSKLPAEAEVTLVVERDSRQLAAPKSLQLPVRLSKRFLGGARPEFSATADPSWRGIKIDYSTAIPAFGFRGGEIDPDGCVAVLDVAKDSVAWKAGLRPGCFISHVEATRVSTPQEFFAIVAELPNAVKVRLTSASSANPVRVIPAP